MQYQQIDIHKSSRTARSYNPMLHVVTKVFLHTFFLAFQVSFFLLRWAKCDCILKVKATIHQGLAKSLTEFYVLRAPMVLRNSCWHCICVLKGPCALVEGHAPPQTINQWALELGVMQPTLPACLLQGNKDTLFSNTTGLNVLFTFFCTDYWV